MGYKKESTSLPIDGDKLKKLIRQRGLNYSEISRLIGKSASYISTCCGTGFISTSVAIILKSSYNIQYDDYKPDVPETSVKPDTNNTIDTDELNKQIRSALMDAINSKVFSTAVIDAVGPRLDRIIDKLNILLNELDLDLYTKE